MTSPCISVSLRQNSRWHSWRSSRSAGTGSPACSHAAMPPVMLTTGLVEAGALEDAGGDGRAVAAAADQRQRDAVARQLGERARRARRPSRAGARDVAVAPLVVGAHVDDVHRRPRGSSTISSAGVSLSDVCVTRIAGRDPLSRCRPSRYPRTSSRPTRTSERTAGLACGSLRDATRRIGVSYGTTHAAQVDRLPAAADAEAPGMWPAPKESWSRRSMTTWPLSTSVVELASADGRRCSRAVSKRLGAARVQPASSACSTAETAGRGRGSRRRRPRAQPGAQVRIGDPLEAERRHRPRAHARAAHRARRHAPDAPPRRPAAAAALVATLS